MAVQAFETALGESIEGFQAAGVFVPYALTSLRAVCDLRTEARILLVALIRTTDVEVMGGLLSRALELGSCK